MINVNQITAQLARMPDQSLQRYAQMHKGDPYILSLALAEANRRRQMRQGAQMSVPEQPKVVDQAVAGMAAPMPESVGIGQLPAGDMNFADGGIVAFADGGSMFGFGVSDEAMALDELRRQAELRRRAEEARYNALVEGRTPTTPAPAATAAKQTPPVAPAPAPAPSAGPGQRIPPAGAPSAGAAPAGLTALPVLQSPSQMYEAARESVPVVDPTAAPRERLAKQLVSGAEEGLRETEADIAKRGDVFAGREARIGKREEKLKDYESTNQSLALLNAGLAIMSTPGSLATAVGKGARVGTEQYAAGLDKLRAAQERLEDAKDQLESLRINRADMNDKQIRDAKAEIRKSKNDAEKLGIEGAALANDLHRKDVATLYGGMMKQLEMKYEGTTKERVAQIAAQTHLDAARIAAGSQLGLLRAVANDPKLAAIYSAKKTDPMQDYTNWLKANPQYMSDPSKALQAYLATQSVLGTTSTTGTAPTGGSVLPRKD